MKSGDSAQQHSTAQHSCAELEDQTGFPHSRLFITRELDVGVPRYDFSCYAYSCNDFGCHALLRVDVCLWCGRDLPTTHTRVDIWKKGISLIHETPSFFSENCKILKKHQTQPNPIQPNLTLTPRNQYVFLGRNRPTHPPTHRSPTRITPNPTQSQLKRMRRGGLFYPRWIYWQYFFKIDSELVNNRPLSFVYFPAYGPGCRCSQCSLSWEIRSKRGCARQYSIINAKTGVSLAVTDIAPARPTPNYLTSGNVAHLQVNAAAAGNPREFEYPDWHANVDISAYTDNNSEGDEPFTVETYCKEALMDRRGSLQISRWDNMV